MKTIPLTNSKLVAIVDDRDYASVSCYKWRAHVCRRTTYAIRSWRENGKTYSTYMHRQLLNAPAGIDVDHDDNNGLNNRRSNIRLMTHAHNLHRIGPQSISGFKGVWWSKQKRKWKTEIRSGDKKYGLGSYDDAQLAALAYNLAAMQLHGSEAFLNPITVSVPPSVRRKIEQRVSDTLSGILRVNQWA